MFVRSVPLLLIVGMLPFSTMHGAERASIPAGAIGSEVPSFQVRNVAGTLLNRSVCHVCRNGSRPVVMVVLRKPGTRQRMLLRNIDRLVQTRRSEGLRAFCVYLGDRPQHDVSLMQTFAHNGQIAMPVGVTSLAIGDAGMLSISAQADATVILYSDRTIRQRFEFSEEELSHDKIRSVLEAADRLVD